MTKREGERGEERGIKTGRGRERERGGGGGREREREKERERERADLFAHALEADLPLAPLFHLPIHPLQPLLELGSSVACRDLESCQVCLRPQPPLLLFGGWGWGFRVQGSGFRVQGSGFRVQSSGFRGVACRELEPCQVTQPPLLFGGWS